MFMFHSQKGRKKGGKNKEIKETLRLIVLGRNNDELNKAAKRVMMMMIAERGNQNGVKGRGAIFDVTTTTTPISPP